MKHIRDFLHPSSADEFKDIKARILLARNNDSPVTISRTSSTETSPPRAHVVQSDVDETFFAGVTRWLHDRPADKREFDEILQRIKEHSPLIDIVERTYFSVIVA